MEEILALADALPAGRIDKNSLIKLCQEWGELDEMLASYDQAGAYLELADVAYYAIKLIALGANRASTVFGVTVTPEDVLGMAVAKYTLRAAPGNPKDDAAERRAIAPWAGGTHV